MIGKNMCFLLFVVCADSICFAKEMPDTPLLSSQRRVTSVTFSPDNKTLAAACWHRVGIWDTSSCAHLSWLKHAELGGNIRIMDIDFSADGKLLASVGNDGKIVIWNVRSGKVIRAIQEPWFLDGTNKLTPPENESELKFLYLSAAFHPIGFDSVSISPNGKLVAAGVRDGAVHVWSIETGEHIATLGEEAGIKKKVRLADIIDNDIRLQKWRRGLAKTGFSSQENAVDTITVWTIPDKIGRTVSEITFSRDGTNIIAQSDDTIRCWDIESQKELYSILNSTEFTFSRGSHAINMVDGKVYLFDKRSGRKSDVITEGNVVKSPLVLSQSGREIICRTVNGDIGVWSIKGKEFIIQFQCPNPEKAIRSLAVAPNGKMIAAYWDDCGIRLFQIKDSK